MPAERANETVDLRPGRVAIASARLHARDTVGDPRRHQVTEVPAIEAPVTEYRCHWLRCRASGRTTLAPLPAQCRGQFGPQLTALIAYLTVVCRWPRTVVQRLLEGALQIPISLGSTQHAWEETRAAVAARYAELQAALPTQPVLNADETGRHTNAAKRWLWTVVAPTFVFYTVVPSHGLTCSGACSGPTFPGILGSDRLLTYTTQAASRLRARAVGEQIEVPDAREARVYMQ